MYQTNSTGCVSDESCKWYSDNFCEINHTKSETCFQKTTQSGCEAISTCKWQADPYSPQDGWCDFAMFECHWNRTLGQSRTNCESNSLCSWVSDPWSDTGWCEPKCFAKDSDGSEVYSTKSTCEGAVVGGLCEWATGWCEPNITVTGSVNGKDCASYDDNSTACEAQPGCAWFTQIMGGSGDIGNEDGGFFGTQCDVKYVSGVDCWRFNNQTSCNYTTRTASYNNSGDQDMCRWVTEGSWSWCEQIGWHCGPMYSPFNMTTYQPTIDAVACTNDPYCMVQIDEYMGNQQICVPSCFNNSLDQTSCLGLNTSLNNQMCTWSGAGAGIEIGMPSAGGSVGGWCDPKGSQVVFEKMEGGKPHELAIDVCRNGSADAALNNWVDICNLGVKETKEDYMFGVGLDSMTYAGVCNGETLWDGSIGSGRKTTKGYWYIDSDGVVTNNCYSDNGAENGFEFKLIAEWTWSDNGLKEKLTAKRCANSSWVAANIRLDTHGKKMCQEMQGMIITVKKADLNNFPLLFNINHPMRIYVVSAGENNTASSPADTVGPGYYKAGSVDFKLEDCNSVGKVDKDADGFYSYEDPDCKYIYMDEDSQMKQVEDCTNSLDDDRDGAIDCYDEQCKDEIVCGSNFVVNATDKEAPSVISIKANENSNTAKIVVKTEERANISIKFYLNDSTGIRVNKTIRSESMQKTNFTDERERFAFDNVIDLNNFSTNADGLNFSLDNATTYYYRVQVCDVSGNCGKSGLKNFTTKAAVDKTTIKVSDSDSGQSWQIDNGSGTYGAMGLACSSSSTSSLGDSINPNLVDEIDLRMQLTNAGGEAMEVRIEGVETGSDVIAPLDLDIGTLTGSVSGATEDYFAIDESDWGGNDGIYNEGHPDTLVLKFPGDDTELWDCEGLSGSTPSNCTNITGYATRSYNSASDFTEWTIANPPIHIWSYIIDQTAVASVEESGASSGGGGGGGGGAGFTTDEEEEEEEESEGSEAEAGEEVEAGEEGIVDEAVQRVAEFVEEVGESFTTFGWLWFVLGAVIAVGVVLFIVFKKKH